MKVVLKQSIKTSNCHMDLQVGWNEDQHQFDPNVQCTVCLLDKDLREIYLFRAKSCSFICQSLTDNRKVNMSVHPIGDFQLVFNSVFKKF